MKQQLIQIPGAKFDPSFNLMKQQKCQFQDKIRYFDKWMMQFQDEQFYSFKWDWIFCYLRQTDVEYLRIVSTQNSRIIKDISIPVYTNLTYLILGKNNISNIEALSFMDMKKLFSLDLQDNNIVNIKPINKLTLPYLSILDLRNNKLQNYNHSRFHTQFRTYQRVFYSIQPQIDNDHRVQDISQISKLENLLKIDDSQLNQVQKIFESKDRIEQFKVFWSLMRQRRELKPFENQYDSND